MKLHLYQSIPYHIIGEKSGFAVDFYSPKNTLEYLHSQICSFTRGSYLCQEAAIFGKWNLKKIPVSLEKLTIGFSLATDTLHPVPGIFSEKVFKSGSYVFTQFKDSSPEGITDAVNGVSNYIISHHLQPATDTIMLRIVHENGGLLTEALQNFAFQICVALDK